MTKFVLRIMNKEGDLLGWEEVQAVARGDGSLWMQKDASILIRHVGVPATLSVHWADVNCEYSVEFPGSGLIAKVGDYASVSAQGPLWTVGPQAGGLPPVEVGSTVIAVPVGTLGVRTH